jgi:hypothetical protein
MVTVHGTDESTDYIKESTDYIKESTDFFRFHRLKETFF